MAFRSTWDGGVSSSQLVSVLPPYSARHSLTVLGVGVFTLLTISLGEELESRFFKVLSCVSLDLVILITTKAFADSGLNCRRF